VILQPGGQPAGSLPFASGPLAMRPHRAPDRARGNREGKRKRAAVPAQVGSAVHPPLAEDGGDGHLVAEGGGRHQLRPSSHGPDEVEALHAKRRDAMPDRHDVQASLGGAGLRLTQTARELIRTAASRAVRRT
jgi:hypothetical protein